MGEWIEVADRSEVPDDGMLAVSAAGLPIVLIDRGGRLAALHDLCTHGQARLSDGFIDGDCIECPLHQGLFEIDTGRPRSPPATEAVRTFPVRVSGGRIEIDIASP